MPIFEYICQKCGHKFEVIVRGEGTVVCRACSSKRIERQLSVFAAKTDNGHSRVEMPGTPCGSCGDPRGPGSCSMN